MRGALIAGLIAAAIFAFAAYDARAEPGREWSGLIKKVGELNRLQRQLMATTAALDIAQRYDVSVYSVEYVISIVEQVFPRDPLLLLALIGVESRWQPWVRGAAGEVGLAQIIPTLHGPTEQALMDIRTNVTVAAVLLEAHIQRRGIRGGIAAYNGTGPRAEAYASRVLAEYARLKEPFQ